MRPQPPASMSGSASRAQRKAENTFTAKMRSSSASSVRRNGALAAMPALLTRMAMGPRSRASAKARDTDAASVTSQTMALESAIPPEVWSSASLSRAIRVSLAPSLASASAVAAPMPREAPVITAWRPASGRSSGTGEVPRQLIAALEIRLRPLHPVVALQGGGAQRPIGVGEMRSRQAAKIGAARRDDAVDVVDLVDIAHRHGRHAGFVADQVREGRLEHAAVNGLGVRGGLAGGNVDDVRAGPVEGAGNGEHVRFAVAFVAGPIAGRDAHRDRLLLRPRRADRGEDFQREAQAVLDRPATTARPLVGP